MQARRDYAPALETQELFTLQWIVIWTKILTPIYLSHALYARKVAQDFSFDMLNWNNISILPKDKWYNLLKTIDFILINSVLFSFNSK